MNSPEWDWSIELDADPIKSPIRFTDKGTPYVQISCFMDQDMIEYLISVKSPETPITGPIEMNLIFYLSRGKRRGSFPHKKESLDELSTFVVKSCVGRLFKNEKQICKRLEIKEYADNINPRVIILIRKLNEKSRLNRAKDRPKTQA